MTAAAQNPRVLVVEGNTAAASARIAAHGGRPYAESYGALLESMAPALRCDIVRPADGDVDCGLEAYAGVAWTGSALNVYDAIPEVRRQLALADRVMAAGLPVFGSCWGLQVFVTALGGKIRPNPRGREIGVAEAIQLTPEGAAHPMYAGKARSFGAFAVHQDETETLPEGAVVLAGNAMSAVQAIAYERGGVRFWGVQYHPEFDAAAMAVTYRRLAKILTAEGVAPDEQAACAIAGLYDAAAAGEAEGPLAEPAVADAVLRTRELRNWLAAFITS